MVKWMTALMSISYILVAGYKKLEIEIKHYIIPLWMTES